LSLAKVKIVKMFRKIRRYEICSGMAAYYVKSVKRTFVKILEFLYALVSKCIVLKSFGLTHSGVQAVCSAE
jgi:hypothetical protein